MEIFRCEAIFIVYILLVVMKQLLTQVVGASAAASACRAFAFNYAGQRVVARLRTQLFAAIVRQDSEYFDGIKTGEVLSRLSSDTETLQVTSSSVAFGTV